MKIFFYFGHPSQFHFYRNIVKVLKEKGNEIHLFIKSKDVLDTLVEETGWSYTNIQPDERGTTKWAILSALFKRDFFVFRQVLKHKPDLLIASDPSFSHVGYIFRIPSLNFMDDDFNAAGYYASVTYPFTTHVITPLNVKMGKWEYKKIGYNGYMKLAYLHPAWFSPYITQIGNLMKNGFFLIRLSGLKAHHDLDKKGISAELLDALIDKLSPHGQVVISGEGDVPEQFKKHVIHIPPGNMHHYLASARLLVSDSQSMSGEAAVLGVPSVRISSFKGKLSVLEELEHRYGLTFAFQPDDERGIFNKIDKFLSTPDLDSLFQKRRQKMLSEKINVTAFCIWFIENYPGSLKIVQQNPDYPNNFK